MDCHDAKERLRRDRSSTAVRRHLARCQDCRDFMRDLADGERELGEAFLAIPPSPGFEERVARRVAEREIAIRRRPRRILAAVAAPLLLVLGIGAIYQLYPPATGRPPAPSPAPVVHQQAVTDPLLDNPLELFLWRERSDSETELLARFAGESETVTLAGDVEEALLRIWVRGARRVEMRVSPEVPGREIIALIELLEKSGFSWEISRKKR